MQSNKKLLYQYAGFAIQLLVALCIATYAGLWIDKKLKLTIPLLIWMLPLLVLIMMILKTVKDTNKK